MSDQVDKARIITLKLIEQNIERAERLARALRNIRDMLLSTKPPFILDHKHALLVLAYSIAFDACNGDSGIDAARALGKLAEVAKALNLEDTMLALSEAAKLAASVNPCAAMIYLDTLVSSDDDDVLMLGGVVRHGHTVP